MPRLLALRSELPPVWVYTEIFVVQAHVEHMAGHGQEHYHDKTVLCHPLFLLLAMVHLSIEHKVVLWARDPVLALAVRKELIQQRAGLRGGCLLYWNHTHVVRSIQVAPLLTHGEFGASFFDNVVKLSPLATHLLGELDTSARQRVQLGSVSAPAMV